VASIPNAVFAAPVFNGDDSALVYAVPDASATGSSLVRQPLAADKLTPSGAVEPWLSDARFGVIYRRGTFTPPQAFNLSVTKAGLGAGLVTSTPEGIVCGADCATSYVSGSTVNLVAGSEESSIFVGWSGGGCSGTGVCTLTITADTVVTATFAADTDGDGVLDGEDAFPLNPAESVDTDGDGMGDNYEARFGLNVSDPNDAALDIDSDGASNLEEFERHRNPRVNEHIVIQGIHSILF
jgi:hypothetical protein